MQLKTIILLVGAFTGASSVMAQDKIMKRDGEVIDAKVRSVGVRNIIYSKYNNPSGPEYTIGKNEVTKIKYENGGEGDFGSEWPMRPMRPHRMRSHEQAADEPTKHIAYAPNVVALAPLQFSDNGLGLSVSYERALDREGIVAFYMPLILTWDLNNGSYTNYMTGSVVNGHQDMMFYAMPGVKLYPTGSFGRVRYSIGPSVVIGTGEHSYFNAPTGEDVVQSQTMLGMIINNSLNMNPTPRVYMGIELGMGFTYLNRIDGINQNTRFLIQGGFKVGYRF